MVIYVESAKDMTRIPVWDFNKAKFDFWEHGRVEIPKFEDFKVSSGLRIILTRKTLFRS